MKYEVKVVNYSRIFYTTYTLVGLGYRRPNTSGADKIGGAS